MLRGIDPSCGTIKPSHESEADIQTMGMDGAMSMGGTMRQVSVASDGV